MQVASFHTIVLLLITAISCNTSAPSEKTAAPVASPEKITAGIMPYLQYQATHVRLTTSYIALDTALQPIAREKFLELLASGGYLPLRLQSPDSQQVYRLHPIPETATDVRGVIQQTGIRYLQYFREEGTTMPLFNWTDLNGNQYTPENTKGKVMALKCWFIACQACKEEMPALNEIVQQYQENKEMLFVSLALDEPAKLQEFMRHTAFRYAVVGDQQPMMDSLHIHAYPTHLVIDRKGKIFRITDRHEELDAILQEALREG